MALTRATISVDPAFLASAAYTVTIGSNINYMLRSFGTDFTHDKYTPAFNPFGPSS